MKDCLGVVFGILLAAAAGDRPPWSQQHWKQSRVESHSGLNIVSAPQLSRRAGPLPGYLPLRPVNYRHSRWFEPEATSKPQSNSRASYENYPPFWSSHKNAKSIRPNPHQNHYQQSHKSHRQPKKDCNPCNSVPWTPIFKSPAGLSSNHHPRELVPQVDVYPDASIHHTRVISPHNLISQVPIPTLPEPSPSLVGLPAGNLPVSPNLLLLPHQQQIPFPELSPYPVAPIHDTGSFYQDAVGLVPPVPPKNAGNVVVTISEHDSKDVHIVPQDQHSDSSSFIDSRLQQQTNLFQNQYHHHHGNQYRPPSGGLDIVKSVPLAEYTSSIDHPIQIIQSNPYIDINSQSNPPSTAEFTYEKSPKTGTQKVSDFILEGGKGADSKKLLDSSPAGSDKVTDRAPSPESSDKPLETGENKPKTSKLEDSYRDHFDPSIKGLLDPNILTPPAPPLPPHLTQLLPTYESSFLHPLLSVDTKGVASSVNGALLPPPQPQPMNPTTLQPTEATIPPKKIQIIIPYTTANNQEVTDHPVSGTVPFSDKMQTWPPIVVTEATQNQARRVPHSQTLNQQTSSESNQVQHILATNIRDLLKKEVEPKQNIRLQKNIDNWTALEYSNHKTVGKKPPSEVISHAQAVTTIPGTSISHLLFPSKKIPTGYFPTSIAPNFDEPATTAFPATSVSVNSEPFTTASRYSSVAWSGPTRTSSRVRVRSTTPITPAGDDHEITEQTTPGPRWSDLRVSVAPGTNEKVYVVTPVSSYGATRRTTRHVETTEMYITEASNNALFTRLEKVKQPKNTTIFKNKEKPLYTKSTALFKIKADASKYEKMSKFNKPKPIEKFFATTTRPLNQAALNKSADEVPPEAEATAPTVTTTTQPPLFPFRNGGEIPLEMSRVNFSTSELTIKNSGSRKTLIKQVKTNRHQKDGKPANDIRKDDEATKQSPGMEVDIVYPSKSGSKKGDGKKPTFPKKKEKDTTEKTDKASIKPDEPNITEDDREEINDLMKELALRAERNHTLLVGNDTDATTLPPSQSQSSSGNSSKSLLDTIKLLREFLAETSEEEPSQEKSVQLEKVINKLNTTERTKKLDHSKYKYDFPEYLTGELQLNKDEMKLVRNAMIELKKNKTKTKDEKS